MKILNDEIIKLFVDRIETTAKKRDESADVYNASGGSKEFWEGRLCELQYIFNILNEKDKKND
jgi:hypothetical protein